MTDGKNVGYPNVNYLSASLELTESGHGEMAQFRVVPLFDWPRVEFHVVDGHDAEEDGVWVMLNRRQVECLSDFLLSWLGKLPLGAATPAAAIGGSEESAYEGLCGVEREV